MSDFQQKQKQNEADALSFEPLIRPLISFSSCQRNLIKTIQIEAMIALITKMVLIFFMRLVKWPKIDVKKYQNLIFKVDFQHQKSFESF